MADSIFEHALVAGLIAASDLLLLLAVLLLRWGSTVLSLTGWRSTVLLLLLLAWRRRTVALLTGWRSLTLKRKRSRQQDYQMRKFLHCF